MKVLFLTNVPSPYRVDFFNELGKMCDLTVTFEKRSSDERANAWDNYRFINFKGVFLKGKSVNTDTAICVEILKYIKDKSFDRVICADFYSPTGMIAIQYMKNHHIEYWLESDGGYAKNVNGFKSRIKRHFISGAAGYFSAGKQNDLYFITYGAMPERIHRYPFTSLHEDDILDSVPSSEKKKELRSKLGMMETRILISVGRFSYQGGYGKGFDILLKVANTLPDVGIYIIADQPTEEFLKMKRSLCADNVHFIGYKNKTDLKEYYQAADLFVLLTRGDVWGLVVNEAMANGLPVITSDMCGAGLELVQNEKNGFLVPINDKNKLVKDINEALCNAEVMGQNALNTIKNYTIETMVLDHIKILLGDKK